MTYKQAFLWTIAAVLCAGYALAYSVAAYAQTAVASFDSPLPTPVPGTMPIQLPPEAEIALQYVAS